jgi:WXXGXW repeat (2 copies)
MKLRSLVFAAFLSVPFASFAEVDFSVNIAPPVMPVYEQPLCPVAGYIWTPGYWAYENDYYWVPGVWVPPPRVGLLWTPPWWGWNNGAYVFNQGYWGPRVGFYGGINYGYGYTGNGYWGGRWSGNTFQYNTAVTRVNTKIVHNTYINNSVNRQVNANRTSFNGPNGIKAEPTAEQRAAAANAKKEGPTSQQLSRQQAAAKDQNLRASVNKGHPNNEAIQSFNKNEGAGQGKGAQGVEAAGGAAGAGAGNKPGNINEHNLQGAGAGPGKAENQTGNSAEHNGQRTGMGGGEEHGQKLGAEDHGNKHEGENLHGNNHNAEGNQANAAGPAHGQHAMNQQMARNAQMRGHNPQMKSGHPQMGGQHQQKKQGGGNHPHPSGQQQQQQGKKKPNHP